MPALGVNQAGPPVEPDVLIGGYYTRAPIGTGAVVFTIVQNLTFRLRMSTRAPVVTRALASNIDFNPT